MTLIQLRVPAEPEYVGLVRSTTTAVLARTSLGYEETLEWPLAIDEAFALVINHRPATGEVLIDYELIDGQVLVTLTGPAGSSGADLEKEVCRWGWNILSSSIPNSSRTVAANGQISVSLNSRVVASA